MNNKKIKIIRKRLDILDNKLLDLIKKRTSLVNEILKQKRFKNQIIDRKRIKTILSKIKYKSLNKRIDPKITNKIWKSMINAFIDYEFRNFKKK
tara:strand:- start:19 stop:300 length:282 start_codon:yes stop_codon:yes gene_type:complete